MADIENRQATSSGGTGREWLFRAVLLTGSLVFSIGLAEIVTRAFFPVYGGLDNVTLDGAPVKEWFVPGSVYRQVSNEYDAITTITPQGHRVPGSEGNPEVVFLGDSFTFGFGLKDDQTFAAIYCQQRRVACANLGIPGSGTSRQVARLTQFLRDFRWHPREVKLFFFGMSGSFSAGNDFVDNYEFGRRREAQAQQASAREAAPPSLAARIIGLQSTLLDHSYLMRRVKFHWGPLLKTLIVDAPGEVRMREALTYTRQGLQQLDDLSRQNGFDYAVYLIVPVQDILRGTDGVTLATLDSVSPRPAIPTAPALRDAPASYYYA
ncbi:MAG: SGNH/GDSL hydrolase family protein, partial [Anaerolineae bacterium]|nr:SGNH/GDSL hydrolase family protein [Anaerolineae bacterium]